MPPPRKRPQGPFIIVERSILKRRSLDCLGKIALSEGRGPLTLRISQAIAEQIISGQLPPGSRLPSSRELASRLGVSRNTAVSAYDELSAMGMVEGKVGCGTTVMRRPHILKQA
ncbi:MAG: winged helix-turn-helix transcriptional regulator [Acidobacteria bacterium]|nr:winged helix-turn-helix transcriptional regulator [Acidobacteriota bacterium]